jgi:hypothetical protein
MKPLEHEYGAGKTIKGLDIQDGVPMRFAAHSSIICGLTKRKVCNSAL